MYGFHSPKCRGCIPTQKWLNFLHNLPKMEGLHSPKWRGSIPIIWAGYSHYLGWVFLLPVPLQGAPCSPYRVLLPVPPTDWVVKRDFKSFWAKLSPLQGAPCPPYRVLPVPPTDWVVKRDFKSFWAPTVPLQLPWLFPYSCPDCSPTGCYLGWIFPLSGRDIFDFWAGYWHLTPVVRTFDRLCQNFWQTLSKHKDLLEISKNYVLALPLLGSGFIDKLFHNLF